MAAKVAKILNEKGARMERQKGKYPWLVFIGKREVACKRLTDVLSVLAEE